MSHLHAAFAIHVGWRVVPKGSQQAQRRLVRPGVIDPACRAYCTATCEGRWHRATPLMPDAGASTGDKQLPHPAHRFVPHPCSFMRQLLCNIQLSGSPLAVGA
eukprot:GHUV01052321.1.p1 GENE.GHUV01052321.1~~GHUV01052321.1.p1  ORF type:complete len:103 (+),score=5.23 GHUV01052321.1:63-371(+)